MNRFKIAQYIALGATACTIIGIGINVLWQLEFGIALFLIGLVAGIVSYCFGGLMTAIKMAWKIAKWGWFVVPFPADIITFLMTFYVALLMFVFLPIIPVRKAYMESGM